MLGARGGETVGSSEGLVLGLALDACELGPAVGETMAQLGETLAQPLATGMLGASGGETVGIREGLVLGLALDACELGGGTLGSAPGPVAEAPDVARLLEGQEDQNGKP